VHVVYLKNADATKLAQTLRAVVSSDPSALPQTGQGTSGGSVQTTGGAPTGSTGQQQQQGGGGNSMAQQQNLGGGGGGNSSAGFIQADASTNTLIITASEAVYRNLRAVIDQLDVRRAQVYLESLIVEVNANKAAEFGVQWLGLTGNSNSKYRLGGVQGFGVESPSNIGNVIAGALGSPASLPKAAGATIGLFKTINGELGLGALAHVLESEGNANILSTPSMLTLDNELSTIKVGQNVPIISGSFTTAGTGAGNPFQTIERKDVGLTLKVRPQISEGGTIKMAIYHETSDVVPGTVGLSSGLTTNIRVIENNVVADDGEIIVIGGLIKDDTGDSEEKVRGLGDIPIIGNLFKYRTRQRNKTNLMVFLRPVIIRSKDDSNNISANRYDYMRSAGEKAATPKDSVLLPDYGTPVLPQLKNGQPPAGGDMAPLPPRRTAAPAAAPAADEPAKYRPVTPANQQ
jgi:general secretion pathway protein D